MTDKAKEQIEDDAENAVFDYAEVHGLGPARAGAQEPIASTIDEWQPIETALGYQKIPGGLWVIAPIMNCSSCGRFHNGGPGSAWKMIYSGVPLQPDHEITRCKSCVAAHGPFAPQSGIKPEYSCGIVEETKP